MSLTVGYVSGIIAASIFLLQFLIPNALIVVIVALLKYEHSTVTWSVVQRNLLSSMWPVFLRSEATASRGVDRSISLLTWLRPLALGLVTIAAVVTPLGLYEEILPSKEPEAVTFSYIQDPGPMGFGTPPRSNLGFTRICGGYLPAQCPGTTVEIITSGNDTFMSANITDDDYDTRIPHVLAQLYQSGLAQQPETVSSFFDIESRQYSYQLQDGMLHHEKYIVTSFRQLQNVLLNDAIEPLEGIIANTKTGGVAFRNHTVPRDSRYGAEWTENLLWIEPETACVDTNISIEFRLPYGNLYNSDLTNISLVDNGGFANLVTEYPLVDVHDSQAHPNLQGRAYKAAWMVNAYSMLIMNITRPSPRAFAYLNSKVGDKYPVIQSQVMGLQRDGLYMSNLFTALLDPGAYISNRSLAEVPGANYSNPFSISGANYSDISLICSGAGGGDLANLTNIHVECGLLFGAARRIDGSKSLVMEPLTWWTQSVYSCATTAKATIKQTKFRYNITASTGNTLRALSVVDVQDIEYADNSSMPLWGVESPRNYTLANLNQLWGLISPDLENSVNLSTIRAPHLYLPGYGGLLSALVVGSNNLPAGNGLDNVLAGVYEIPLGGQKLADYTGSSNIALYAKWRDLAESAKAISKIPNLIWTDIAANMLVGTRKWGSDSSLPPNLQKRDESSSTEKGEMLVPVTVYDREIRYHWPFAVPALLSLLLGGLVASAALLSVFLGRGAPGRVQYYLCRLSSGRLLGSTQYPEECDSLAPTRLWIARIGERPCDLEVNRQPTKFTGRPLTIHEKPDGVADVREMEPTTIAEHTSGHVPPAGYMKVPANEQVGNSTKSSHAS